MEDHIDTLTPDNAATIDVAFAPMVRLWTLRALMRANVCEEFVGEHRFKDEAVARLLGWADAAPEGYDQPAVLRQLQEQLAQVEQQPPGVPIDTVLARNIEGLGERVGLKQIERELLLLCVLQRQHDTFSALLEMAGHLSTTAVIRLLAACLGRHPRDVGDALAPGGRLDRTALISIERMNRYPFSMKIDMLTGLADDLIRERADLLEIFRRSVVAATPATLALDSFAHMADDIAILRGLLEGAVRRRARGVNVLIHGRPGTGKSEFVRALVDSCGLRLLEIPCDEADGRPRDGGDRFVSYRLAQSLLAGSDGVVLLFDEVEDALNGAGVDFDEHGNRSGLKGWINHMLEHNPTPAFWVTNHLASIDPAHRRRFDMVLKFDVPPAAMRRAAIDRHAQGLSLPDAWRTRAARHAQMPPAVLQRATKVGMLVCGAAPQLAPEDVVGRVVNHSLQALGCALLPEEEGADRGPALAYRPDLLNADCDLSRLCDGLRRVREGRLCLYGPPGTGKTEFGRYLARELELPLLVRRTSDLLSPYVGAAERNIARMFEQARSEGSVLMLDEADSLLRDRRHAQRSWEVTQVNEMLTQMESFRGIFIASTNLIDTLDEASMRRFDLRVKLGYLRAKEVREMFASLACALGLVEDAASLRTLDALDALTPGDFAAVARGARLDAPLTAAALAARLAAACESKREGKRRPIGFVA